MERNIAGRGHPWCRFGTTVVGAGGGGRTHTAITGQGILSPLRLPFRHTGSAHRKPRTRHHRARPRHHSSRHFPPALTHPFHPPTTTRAPHGGKFAERRPVCKPPQPTQSPRLSFQEGGTATMGSSIGCSFLAHRSGLESASCISTSCFLSIHDRVRVSVGGPTYLPQGLYRKMGTWAETWRTRIRGE